MIVTVTLNPALLVDYEAGQVSLGTANRVRRVRYRTGGRGLAVARVLHTFGHDVVAAGLAGGTAGELIRTELARAGVATQFTRISAESRRVLLVAGEGGCGGGPGGQVTTFAEPAPYITTEELGRLAADYRSLLDGATAVVLCGSLPDGLPEEIYGSFVSYAASAGVPVVLEAVGSALAHGARRGPALVIPAGAEAAGPASLLDTGAAAVAVSESAAASVFTAQGRWHASLEPAPGRSVSKDALVAGLVPGIALGWSWPDLLRHALALAVAVAESGEVDFDAYERYMTNIRLSECP